MAKIVVDARELNSSTGRYIERLLHYLQRIDNQSQYLVLLKSADFDKWQPTAKNFSKIASPYKEFTFGEQFGLKKQLKQLKPDLVHFGMVQQPLLYRGKAVATMHDLTTCRFKNPGKNPIVYWAKQQVYKFVNWYVPRKDVFIITPSEATKKDVVQFAHLKRANKIVVTHESADELSEAAKPIETLKTKDFIFYVGRPQPHKNLARLIEAFAIIKKTHPNLLLVLAGRKDKVYDGYIKDAECVGVADSVIFTGFVTDGELKWLYQNCRAYIFPSLAEGFGLPGLEAMVHRAPVVSSTLTSLPEIYGDAAWYFDPYDVPDMARSITEVLDNKELRNKLILAGRKQAAKYSWEKMAKETLEVYERALRS